MLKSLTPKFIKQLDTYLLENHPVVWSSKIHFVLWHGAILWLLSGILGLLVPIDLHRRVPYEMWYFIFTVLAVVLLGVWIYHYIIFNKEKKFGNKQWSDEYKNFFLCFFAVAIFLLSPVAFEIGHSRRIANLFTEEELIQDLNALNTGDPYTLQRYSHFYSWYDSITDKTYFTLRELSGSQSNPYTPWFLVSDSLKYPDLLTPHEVYKNYKPYTDKAHVYSIIENYKRAAAKYGCPLENSTENMADYYLALVKKEKIYNNDVSYYGDDSYKLETALNNVLDAKYKRIFIYDTDYMLVMMYFVLAITILLLLFRVVYWQQFLIMCAVAALYPILTFIIAEFIRHDYYVSEETFIFAAIFILILFSWLTVIMTAREKNYYRPFFNIFNQIAYLTLFVTPILVIALLYNCTGVFHKYDYYYNHSLEILTAVDAEVGITAAELLAGYYSEYWQNVYHQWLAITQFGGIALYIVLLPLLKELFIRQLALPKKR